MTLKAQRIVSSQCRFEKEYNNSPKHNKDAHSILYVTQ